MAPISEDDAIEIGREYGLRLVDISALQRLARGAEHAKQLAEEFGGKSEAEPDVEEIVKGVPR